MSEIDFNNLAQYIQHISTYNQNEIIKDIYIYVTKSLKYFLVFFPSISQFVLSTIQVLSSLLWPVAATLQVHL